MNGVVCIVFDFFFQAEDGIRDIGVTGVQTCALPIWERLALKAEHPVGVVLYDDEVELAGDLEQLAPAFRHQRHPGGVLEVGYGVDEFDVEAPFAGLVQRLAGGGRADAGPVHGDVRYARPVGSEGVQGAGVGRALAKDRVALVEKDLGDKVESLLGARGDEDVLLPGRGTLGSHHLHYDVLYRLKARGWPVLQRLGRVRRYAARDLPKRLLPEGPRVGEASGERDDAGPREGRHEVAGGRSLHALDPLGVEEVEAVEVYERHLRIPLVHQGLDVLPAQTLREGLPELGCHFEAAGAAAPSAHREDLERS